jgi:cellobiose-specific phosphotransferase system component IIA
MKSLLAVLLLSGVALGQAVPSLSTADKAALADAEKAKQAAQKQFQDAQEFELQVMREWGAAHPGWHVNPQTFAVEADKKVEVKPEEKK